MPALDSKRFAESLSPFSRKIGVQAEDIGMNDTRLRLPALPENQNLWSATHEGAVFSLGEAAAVVLGVAAFDPTQLTFVTKKAEIRYRRAGKGDLWARARLSDEARQTALDQALTEGKAEAAVPVEITDLAGERVADATVTLSIRRL